jgi:hypothetical protein
MKVRGSLFQGALIGSLALASQMALAAASVSSAFPAGIVALSDNSAEQFIDKDNNGVVTVGDVFRGILSIDNITGINPASPQVAIGAGTGYNELTGIFQIVVTSAVADGTKWDFTFGADPASGFGSGVAVQLYDDAAQNFSRVGCATTAICEATATGGTLWATLGLGANGFWTTDDASNTPNQGFVLPFSTPLGDFSIALNFIDNFTGFSWSQVPCLDLVSSTVTNVDVCGQGGILATGSGLTPPQSATPYGIFNNVDFTVNRVPEPGALALVGLALGIGGLVSRRRRS